MNEECFPTCVYCHAVLVEVPSIPVPDPAHPEHEERQILADRHRLHRGKLRWAALLYAAAVTALAAVPGLVFEPLALVLYFLSGWVVGGLVNIGLARSAATLLQGAFTLLLVWQFGPVHPFTFFMLASHIIGPAVLWHWVEIIQSLHR